MPEDSDATKAFLACSEGDLCERTRKWLEFVEKVKREMQQKEDLACINSSNTKNKG